MSDVLFGGVGDLILRRASRKVFVGGQGEKSLTSPYPKAVMRWGDCAAPLASPEITRQLTTLAVNEKERRKSKLNTLYRKRELSLLCTFWAV